MTRPQRSFPLVADNEPVITPPRVMSLYETEDLITNIKGHYQDKIYADEEEQVKVSDEVTPESTPSKLVFEPAERARQEARADLKRKRQALLAHEKVMTPKSSETVVRRQKTVALPSTGWGEYAQSLRQESYILAELPQTYQEPDNPSTQAVKKNSYDFLKRSQIYNQEDNQRQKERRVAQELNLSRIEDSN